ncbi:hypothetical protein BD310DRAFT_1037254, partial [Dichomitus squalens]
RTSITGGPHDNICCRPPGLRDLRPSSRKRHFRRRWKEEPQGRGQRCAGHIIAAIQVPQGPFREHRWRPRRGCKSQAAL